MGRRQLGDSVDLEVLVNLRVDLFHFYSIMEVMNVTLKEFPDHLHAKLKIIAESSGRSLNRQIIYLLAVSYTHLTLPTTSRV